MADVYINSFFFCLLQASSMASMADENFQNEMEDEVHGDGDDANDLNNAICLYEGYVLKIQRNVHKKGVLVLDPEKSVTKGRRKRVKGHFEKRKSSTQKDFGTATPKKHII
ncbi:unnamed protein product [Amaranthus hypochondriacus]